MHFRFRFMGLFFDVSCGVEVPYLAAIANVIRRVLGWPVEPVQLAVQVVVPPGVDVQVATTRFAPPGSDTSEPSAVKVADGRDVLP